MSGYKTTFWSFLNSLKDDNKIEIPIIQRDYAQGREGEESLRERFLDSLKQAIDDSLNDNLSDEEKERKVVTLDFVYGSEKNGNILPLDGQQRLTTLWLLHWYIAYKAGVLDDKDEGCNGKTVKDILKKFSYETRVSSRDFCDKLSEFDKASENNDSIKKHIQNQTWFYLAWNQDPTVQSMLRMLSGTEINDKEDNDIIDSIEKLFEKTEQNKYKDYWNKLTKDSPIVFYYMSLENFGLSDDLYVKMNARGKTLTDFENFKAELIGYIREQHGIAKENNSEDKDSWKELLNEKEGIPIKLDTDWTDIFWNNRSKDNKIDDIYFAFMNRFFLNYKIKDLNDEKNQYYKYFTGEKRGEKDIDIKYHSLNNYKWNGKIDRELFDDLKTILDKYYKFYKEIKKGIKEKEECESATEDEIREKLKKEIEDIFRCAWDKFFEFIPIYYKPEDEKEEKEIVSTLSQVQRIVFFAICKYFKEFEGDEIIDDKSIEKYKKQLKSWMRVVWNLVSGKDPINKSGDSLPQIRTVTAMKNAIKDIDNLDSHKVYESFLKLYEANYTLQYSSEHFKQRWNEEIVKARQILDDDGKTLRKYNDEKNWEDFIIEAEEYSFFNGAIRFLYQNEKGEVDWGDDNFAKKFRNAKRYFKELKESESEDEKNYSCLNDEFNNFDLFKAFISRFEKETEIQVIIKKGGKGPRVFNNKADTWRYYLLNNELYSPVHQLMSGEIDIKDNKDKYISLLTKTGLLDFVIGNKEMLLAQIQNGYYGYIAMHQEHKGCVCLNADRRDGFLNNDKKIEVNSIHKIDKCNLLFGFRIHFNYKHGKEENYFAWWEDNYIYLKSNPEPKDTCIIRDNNAKGKGKRFYCFSTKGLEDNEIIENLDKLISEYKKDIKNKE